MKVVLDTNVIVAAFASHGLCHLVFETVVANHTLIISPYVLKEIERAFIKKIKTTTTRCNEVIRFLKNQGTLLKDVSDNVDLECRDPNDLHILTLAVHSKANVLVSGDQDLLVLKRVQNIPILSPREFWEMLRSQS